MILKKRHFFQLVIDMALNINSIFLNPILDSRCHFIGITFQLTSFQQFFRCGLANLSVHPSFYPWTVQWFPR